MESISVVNYVQNKKLISMGSKSKNQQCLLDQISQAMLLDLRVIFLLAWYKARKLAELINWRNKYPTLAIVKATTTIAGNNQVIRKRKVPYNWILRCLWSWDKAKITTITLSMNNKVSFPMMTSWISRYWALKMMLYSPVLTINRRNYERDWYDQEIHQKSNKTSRNNSNRLFMFLDDIWKINYPYFKLLFCEISRIVEIH